MNAPVALFVYSRPDHTRRTVEALQKNHGSANTDLIIFSDGARTLDKKNAVQKVREYIHTISGFRSVTIYCHETNLGLAKSIIEGVSKVLQSYDRIVVVEDDLETSPYFLGFMNAALNRYADNERVISVHGYVLPTEDTLPETFFLRGADCWGWGTWRDKWSNFNPNGQFLLDELKRQGLVRSFDFNGAYKYAAMLEGQIKGLNDSWAVRWYASAYLANKLTLYPGRSLVRNIGIDGSGTHSTGSDALRTQLSMTPILLGDIPIEESTSARQKIEWFLRWKRSPRRRFISYFMIRNIKNKFRDIVKDWLPPSVVRKLRTVTGKKRRVTFEGPFSSWDEACLASSGYDDQKILDKVIAATLRVKRCEVAFERDSVLFTDIQYSWPVTAGLMRAAAMNEGKLTVLDFGGSLGSSYFQNRKFLKGLKKVRWCVIEQPHFVKAGRSHFENEELAFYDTIEEFLLDEQPNVILVSSVLQYLPNPYSVINSLLTIGAETILLDQTMFSMSGREQIFIQNVPKLIYEARYPVQFLCEEKLVQSILQSGYQQLERFPSLDFESLNGKAKLFGHIYVRSEN